MRSYFSVILNQVIGMEKFRIETDSLGEIKVPADRLWGAQTQRSLKHFNISDNLMPEEMIRSYAIIKKSAAIINHKLGKLEAKEHDLILQVCDEILDGKHNEQFPLHVWMSGSGTQFNMNVNEVISNRCSQIAGESLGSKIPVHPNDHVNMSQSSNDTFPAAMCISAVENVLNKLKPSVINLRDSLTTKSKEWNDIVKVGRTHLQDATPLTLGQEFSGYVGMLDDNLTRLDFALNDLYLLALGGTAVGTGINAPHRFGEDVAKEIAKQTGLPFKTAPNKFTIQGSHDSMVMLSSILKTLATSLFKIANDIRILSCGPRCGIHELNIPENEPGSSIMPGKVNPSQCELLSMIAVQVMANDFAVTMGGGGGHLEMNAYKPLIIHNIIHSIRLLTDGCNCFNLYLVKEIKPNIKQINRFLEQSLMLVTALTPVIGYDKSAKIAQYALDHDLTLKEAALKLGYVSQQKFDEIVDPKKMI